ncbi:MAG: SDR family NAD(P)-dependent oxidoreductase [Pirellula sp.]
MARRRLGGLRVLLTGASSGIGFALAKELIRSGALVLATARRADRLDRLSEQTRSGPGKLFVLAGDLTSQEHRLHLSHWCQEHWQGLDVLVNNAGAGAIGPFEHAGVDRLRRVMEIDFFAPAELTRLCIPLLKSGTGQYPARPAILNIGSVLAHRAVPNKSEYCAAKFALRGWAESLRVELADQGIDVLMVSPSTTRSEFFDSLVDTAADTKSRSLGSMSPERVAQLALTVLRNSKREMILSLGGKALVAMGRWFPGLTDRILAKATKP